MKELNQNSWLKDEPARDSDGNVCPVKDGVCWCLAGWMLLTGQSFKVAWLEAKKRGYRSVSQFNDDSTWEEIVDFCNVCNIRMTQ